MTYATETEIICRKFLLETCLHEIKFIKFHQLPMTLLSLHTCSKWKFCDCIDDTQNTC